MGYFDQPFNGLVNLRPSTANGVVGDNEHDEMG